MHSGAGLEPWVGSMCKPWMAKTAAAMDHKGGEDEDVEGGTGKWSVLHMKHIIYKLHHFICQ